MILLRSDCLVFEMTGGDKIPCSVEQLTVEVLADSTGKLDPDVVHHAAAAVLHYFKDDLGRETVTVDEFTAALEHVLRGLGFDVQAAPPAVEPIPVEGGEAAPKQAGVGSPHRVAEADLASLAAALGEGLELGFYPLLRTELRTLLAATPAMVRFHSLRQCAKRLAGVQRWCPRSLEVSDEIVRFLRDCWGRERPNSDCSLMVN